LRGTPLNKLIPFDNYATMHQIIALTGLFFVLMHITGHFVNFFSVATEPTAILSCLFTEVYWVSNFLPKFSWWIFGTQTGFSGYLCTLVVITMYIFASRFSRLHVFFVFLNLHRLCAILFYMLMLTHGFAELIQVPIFHTYLIGPAFLFIIDWLISIGRSTPEIPVVQVERLPSQVLCLKMRKPANFNYKAGQFLRIASSGISSAEFHPFTITSAPHEKYLSVHIRCVGPWTTKLWDVYNPNYQTKYPPVLVDGPYGSSEEDWSRFESVVLVGGGIGVTPAASILKDFAWQLSNNKSFKAKRLLFFWVCRTQKQFEWLVDIIREAEGLDINGRLEVHIFVTELQQKFDLRTIMLYICEKQFHKIHNASLFTGLRSSTHFGRPDFDDLFEQLQSVEPADQVRVFSCGPSNLLASVDDACNHCNQLEGARFIHHSVNF